MSHDGPRFSMPTLTPAIKLLMAVNAAVFAANMLLLGRLSDSGSGDGGHWFAFAWTTLLDGYGLGSLRVVSYQFTHSFRDPMHLLMNLLVLWFFGPMAEQRLGRAGTLRLYLWGGFAGALGHLAIASVQGMTHVPLVGASGACYAFLLYAACLAPHSTVLLVFVPVPLWGLAALLLGLGVYHTFVDLSTGFAGGVSHGAHLGGALLGFVACRRQWFVDWLDGAGRSRGPGPIARCFERLRERRRARRVKAAAASEQQLDTILAKVKAEGLSALRPDERRVLERISAKARSGDS
jgi:membrane associated rhomboid family serine protease